MRGSQFVIIVFHYILVGVKSLLPPASPSPAYVSVKCLSIRPEREEKKTQHTTQHADFGFRLRVSSDALLKWIRLFIFIYDAAKRLSEPSASRWSFDCVLRCFVRIVSEQNKVKDGSNITWQRGESFAEKKREAEHKKKIKKSLK